MTKADPTLPRWPAFDVRLVTLRGVHEGVLPVYRQLRRTDWDYLTGNLDPTRGALVTVCVWDVRASRWLLPPEYLAEYRRRAGGNRQRVLAVAYHYMPGLNDPDWLLEEDPDEEPERLSVDFAWRLERHWLVEWSDLPKGHRRPPVLFAGPYESNVLIGADLPPRLLGVQAALFAFPLITADELRVALLALRQPEASVSDLSRALAYFEESGMLHEAPAALADAYRQHRRVGRRPLGVYLSVPHHADRWRGEWRRLGVQSLAIRDWAYVGEIDRALKCEISDGINMSVDAWRSFADALHARGLRTVWQPAVNDASDDDESESAAGQGDEPGPPAD